MELADAVYDLAIRLVDGAALPAKALEDAFHIAIATAHGMDYLLTLPILISKLWESNGAIFRKNGIASILNLITD